MKDNKDMQIKLTVNNKELEQIKNSAKACGKTTSAYIRELALNMCVIEPDASCVVNHTSEISSYRRATTQLIFTILKTGNYTPADLEYIVNNTSELLKSEKEFLNLYQKSVESEKKLIARIIRQEVKKIFKAKIILLNRVIKLSTTVYHLCQAFCVRYNNNYDIF